jgi:hypothetical protein
MSAHSITSRQKLRHRFFLIGTGLIFLFWAMLYLPNLRTAPNWYGDEILTLDIGKSLVKGQLANRAVFCTFFSPTYNYQPEFAYLTGLFSWLTGGDLLGGRFFSTLVGLLTALTGFYFVSRKRGFLWGLLFAITLLGYSQAVIHYRWIYPHDAVGLGILGATLLLMRPARSHGDWKAGAFLAIGAGSHLLAIHATALALLCRLKRSRSWFPVGLPPFLVICGSLLFVWLHFHGWLWEDLKALGEIYSRYSDENGRGIRKLFNFLNFFLQDPFHMAALLGCLLCLRRRTYIIAFMALGLTFLLTQNRQNLPLFYYQAMIVFPLLALAIIFGLQFLSSLTVRKFSLPINARRVIPLVLIALSLALGARNIPAVLSGNLPTRVAPWVISSPTDYDETAKWINAHTDADDLVISYWTLGWQLKCHTADVLTACAWASRPAGDYFPTPPSHDRFRWDSGIGSAKYFVLTDLDQAWALAQGDALANVRDSGVDNWPLVYSCGTTRVLENPKWKNK